MWCISATETPAYLWFNVELTCSSTFCRRKKDRINSHNVEDEVLQIIYSVGRRRLSIVIDKSSQLQSVAYMVQYIGGWDVDTNVE
jgi:hypothetical protein